MTITAIFLYSRLRITVYIVINFTTIFTVQCYASVVYAIVMSMCVCVRVCVCHTPLIEINNVVDDGLLFITPWTVDAIQGLRLKLHQFDLSLYLLETWLYNISITNRPSGV